MNVARHGRGNWRSSSRVTKPPFRKKFRNGRVRPASRPRPNTGDDLTEKVPEGEAREQAADQVFTGEHVTGSDGKAHG